MSDKKGLSYEQRKAMYEQNIRDTDGKRHIDKLRDDTHNSNANNNGSKKNDPSKRHRAERIQLTPPVRETIPEQKAEPAPEKRIRKEKKHKSGRFKKWWKNIPAAPVMEYVPNAKRGRFDMPLFTVVIILLVMGIIMMSSASYAYALQEEGNSFAYAQKQLVAAVVGFVVMIILSRIDYRMWARPFKMIGKNKDFDNGNGLNPAMVFFGFSVILMILVIFKGDAVADAKRWITIAGVQIQPSELLKIASILLVAYLLQRNYERRKERILGCLLYLCLMGIICVLCYEQRHVSAMIIFCVLIYAMMIVGECNAKGLILLAVLAVVGVLIMYYVVQWDYITERVQGWLDPFSDMGKSTYQTSQSLITIGSGNRFGLGLGNSRQKYYYLPESQNDFVFSIICEELGFFGGMTVILLFVLFEVRGFFIAARAKDKFGSLVAFGITLQIGLQAILNIAVACNAIPNTGISLPFFSYGRSALLTQLAEVGILLSISKDANT